MKNNEKELVVGLGSALVDVIIHETDDFIKTTGSPKGSMTLVENDFIDKILLKTTGKAKIVPGGSACNTIIGIGRLGGSGRFVGKCGKDKLGELFESELMKSRVEPMVLKSTAGTGRALSVITPDAQRTFFTCLGASSETLPDEITDDCFKSAAIVHIEGYLLSNYNVMIKALKSAKKTGATISLDLASFNLVEDSRDIFKELIKDYVNILIANEDEARAYTGVSDEDAALAGLAEDVEIAVMKLGERGCMIASEDGIVSIGAEGGKEAPLDTTGAGDLWAAGFLFGLVNGYSMEKSGSLGSICGWEVCRVEGANIPENGWKRIKLWMENNK